MSRHPKNNAVIAKVRILVPRYNEAGEIVRETDTQYPLDAREAAEYRKTWTLPQWVWDEIEAADERGAGRMLPRVRAPRANPRC